MNPTATKTFQTIVLSFCQPRLLKPRAPSVWRQTGNIVGNKHNTSKDFFKKNLLLNHFAPASLGVDDQY
ncbi:MAG: hypothetical protein ACI9WS_002477 [Paraglaciecola psychrophila]